MTTNNKMTLECIIINVINLLLNAIYINNYAKKAKSKAKYAVKRLNLN